MSQGEQDGGIAPSARLASILQMPEELRAHSWGKWFWWVQLGAVALTVAATIATLLDPGVGWARAMAALVVACAFVVWGWLVFTHWSVINRSVVTTVGYCLVELGLLLTLIGIHSIYALLIFFVYWRMFSLVSGPRALLMAAVISLGIFWAFSGFSWDVPSISAYQGVLFLLSLAGSGILAGFIGSIISESERRRELLEQLQAARAELSRRQREAGVHAERQRLAGEVHDTLAQDFASIVMHLEAAEAKILPDTPIAPHLIAAKQTARDGLAESRRIVQALRPELLEGRSLADALETYAKRWAGETGIACVFTCNGDEPATPREVEVLLYRGLQESLTNVRKHAAATQVVVTLSNLGDEIILDVRDDGVGFVPDVMRDEGDGRIVGLIGMRERARTLGAEVVCESVPGEGATISIQVPLDVHEDKGDLYGSV